MSYLIVEDFKGGLDVRRSILTSPPGTAYKLKNAHINRGGEIEQRKAFVPYATLRANTFGLVAASGNLYTFGSVEQVFTISSYETAAPQYQVVYTRLAHPTNPSAYMTELVDVTVFNGKTWVIAKFSTGDVFPYYNGVIVSDFLVDSGSRVAGVKPQACTTLGGKLHIISGSIWYFSAVDDPTSWKTTDVGSGFIEMSNQYFGAEALVGLANYQGNLAFFSQRTVQIWSTDADPRLNKQLQVLNNIGTFAKKSIVTFGDSDVLFLSDTGVRSLRARDSSNFASVSDIGTPIDDEINALVRSLSAAGKAACFATIEPLDGRYLLTVGGKVYVFSFFYNSKVSAWSTYELSAGAPSAMAQIGNQIYVRINDAVYLYGGADGVTYDTDEVEVVLPFLSAGKPATKKVFTGFDAAVTGVWTIEMGMDTSATNARDVIATIGGPTFSMEAVPMAGEGTHMGLRLIKKTPDRGVLSNLIVHFETGEKED